MNFKKAGLICSLVLTPLILTGCGKEPIVTEFQTKTQAIYELAKENGAFSGTYEEWLESIKGEPGKDGLSITDIVKLDSSSDKAVYKIIFSNGSSKELVIPLAKGEQGEPGKDGVDGKDGRSIVSISLKSTEVNIDTYEIKYSDGTTSTFIVTNGKDGPQGIQGVPGADGHSPKIEVNEEGHWVVDGKDTGKSAIGPQGPIGPIGPEGPKGEDGRSVLEIKLKSTEGKVDTYEIKYSDGTSSYFTITNGKDGSTGAQGEKGEQGIQGVPGKDGHTPVITINNSGHWVVDGKDTGIVAQGPQGPIGPQGPQGEPGKDGADGQDGQKGEQGQKGDSAYDIYLKTHPEYVGSESQWMDDLVNGRLSDANTCVVTFMVDDQVYETQAVIKGHNVVKPKDPSKTRNRFIGWKCNDTRWFFEGFSVSYDITLTAEFVSTKHTVGLDYNNGTGQWGKADVYYGEPFKLPVPEYYLEFKGWFYHTPEGQEIQLTDNQGNSLKNFEFDYDLRLHAVYKTGTISGKPWSWTEASKDKTLNYCLLIGQLDHEDSASRTSGVRDILKTRNPQHLSNPNIEKAVSGEVVINNQIYTTNELVAAEQKNDYGYTWDQATATETMDKWTNIYGDSIDFVVSNNDGMAEGALGAPNFREGLPIFGHDANKTTLSFIDNNQIAGTVSQNPGAQVASMFMLARNAFDGFSQQDVVSRGFIRPSEYGQINAPINYNADERSLLSTPIAITKQNVNEARLTPREEVSKQGINALPITPDTNVPNAFVSYYCSYDTFIDSSLRPLFNEFGEAFNFNLSEYSGDGNDEMSLLNYIEMYEAQDAYFINMIRPTSAPLYLDKIAGKLGATPEKPTNVPVIFFNREPKTIEGVYDSTVLKDSRFNNVYYVGNDANKGGLVQGQMILDYFENLAK